LPETNSEQENPNLNNKTRFLGSTVSVLLLFSVVSYADSFVQQQQEPKASQATPAPASQPIAATTAGEEAAPAKEAGNSAPVISSAETAAKPAAIPAKPAETFAVPASTYTATAYSLRGRTASGKPVTRGLIAADPRVLPIGTRVRLEAGSWSGEYVVADTGGKVKGRRIDVWTPTAHEAMRFGRRAVKLTVLELGGKRKNAATRSRLAAPAAPASQSQATSQK
jgi:3D (Asp-Asp-Asp) domain-containing protein